MFVIKPQSVAAKELSPFQTKIIGNGNFGIYQRLTRRGPACWIGSTRTFRHGNFQASAHVTVEVRSDDNEGIVKADKTPRPGAGSATSWFKKNEEQKTGNVVIPKQKLDKFLQDHDDLYKANQRLKRYVETDLPKENKELIDDYNDLRHRFNVNVDDYNDLLEQKRSLEKENKTLKDTVKSLKKEIGSIYLNVKDAFKRILGDSKQLKDVLKGITHEISKNAPRGEFERLNENENKQERTRSRGMSR